MLWSIGFMVTFVIGGMTGVLLAVPPADFVLHNSLFLVAHFHNVIIGAVLFGAFAGYTYWFPKAFGFRLDDGWAKRPSGAGSSASTWLSCRCTCSASMGMTRRMQHYDRAEWHPWVLVAGAGALIILCGIAFQVAQLSSFRFEIASSSGDAAGDPWDGRSLEWATASPPPAFNFAVLPHVSSDEPYWGSKRRARELGALASEQPRYEPLHMPRNSADWIRDRVLRGDDRLFPDLAHLVAGHPRLLGAYVTVVFFAWRDVAERAIPADEVARLDQARARAARLEPEPAR